MAAKGILRSVNLLCDPRNMNIEAEFPVDGRYIIVTLIVDGKSAYSSYYNTTNSFPKKEKEYDIFINKFCNRFLSFSENELYGVAENYMTALNAHRNLKKVLSRSGRVVWRSP
tara:strand:- start:9193 stop:9531 length:339 start_codon:yes stop_codon:yes gene_type:complete